MTGGGTCRDVCQDLGIECVSFDLREGQDAANPQSYDGLGEFDFVWLHPPYWRQIVYNDDPRCLSNAATIEDFLTRLGAVLTSCRSVLAEDGKIAVLMGNYSDKGRLMPLTYLTMLQAMKHGLWPACTDIVRLQYNNTSSRKVWHCTCMGLIWPRLPFLCPSLGQVGRASSRCSASIRKAAGLSTAPMLWPLVLY